MGWKVIAIPEVKEWIDELDPKSRTRVIRALARLREEGPTLGRPLSDVITDSNISNLKELRPTTRQDTAIRILYVFDPKQQAVLLVAGDKAKGKKKGKAEWNKWYRTAIARAENRYRQWLADEAKRKQAKD